MEIVVDVQAFKYNDEPVFKELALVNLNDDDIDPAHWIFSPPCPWEDLPNHSKRENRWLMANFHGLDWDAGNIPYDRHQHIIKDFGRLAADTDEVMIYVKGRHKVEWLTRYVDHVFDLEDVFCPSLHEPGFRRPVVCSYHRPGWTENCALQNVMALKRWIRNTSYLPPMPSSSDDDDDDEETNSNSSDPDDDHAYYTSESCSLTLTSNSDHEMYVDMIDRLDLGVEEEEGVDVVD